MNDNLTDLREQIVRYYLLLRRHGCNDSHSGNLSARYAGRIWMTPTGACADTLAPPDLVSCRGGEPPPPRASLDAPLHLAVYEALPDAATVMHSHCPHALALTLAGNDFRPLDFEGQLYFPRVPVLSIDYARYLEDSPGQVTDALRSVAVTVVRGHGVYVRAATLDQAYKLTCSLEHSARIAWLAGQARTDSRS